MRNLEDNVLLAPTEFELSDFEIGAEFDSPYGRRSCSVSRSSVSSCSFSRGIASCLKVFLAVSRSPQVLHARAPKCGASIFLKVSNRAHSDKSVNAKCVWQVHTALAVILLACFHQTTLEIRNRYPLDPASPIVQDDRFEALT